MAEVMSSKTGKRAVVLAVALSFFVVGSDACLASTDDPISGGATVVDGDTFDIGGERIRLEGIDAPEMTQTCTNADGGTWACGRAAERALSQMTVGQIVLCDRKGHDKYKRTLAVCYVAGEDINSLLVRRGLARAFVKYSLAYSAEEESARAEHLGVWQADNIAPWDYRHDRWQTAEGSAPQGCAIKGNISGHGKIYHVPWSAWYDKVKVDAARGERWFCSEAEALAAGWRPAQQL